VTAAAHSILSRHAPILERLSSALRSEQSAHAYLFTGPGGIGKTAIALEYARMLVCDEDGPSACNRCPQCVASRNLQHPDLHLVFPLPPGSLKKSRSAGDSDEIDDSKVADAIADRLGALAADPFAPTGIDLSERKAGGASGRARLANVVIRLPQIRDLLRKVARKGYQARRKAYVILQADRMNVQAQNALLKALEEPPPDGYFLLVCERPSELLPTIRSRCQAVRVGRLESGVITDALVSEGIDPKQAEVAAKLANGNYVRARDLAARDLLELQSDVINFLAESARCNPLDLPDAVGRALEQIEATDRSYFDFLGLFLRDAALCGTLPDLDSQHVVFSGLRGRIQRVASSYPGADFQRAIAAVDQSAAYVALGYTPELVLTALAIRIHAALGTRVSGAG